MKGLGSIYMSEYLKHAGTMVPWLPDWVVAVALITAILAFLFSVQDFVVQRILLRLEARGPVLIGILERSRNIIRFGVVLLAVSAITPLLPFGQAAQQSIHNVLIAAVIVLVGWLVSVAANIAAADYIAKLRLDVTDNLLARKALTQVRVLRRLLNITIGLLTAGFALMTFDSVRQFGVSIFASAGAAGIVLGLAARPVLSNLIAGIQIALTQPIRLEDAVIVEGEYGWIEELASTYVVVRLWDRRRLVVPLNYFLEKPFQNWTRKSSSIIGSVMLYLDYGAPIGKLRERAISIAKSSKLWDGDVAGMQVTDANEGTIQIRVLVSAASSGAAWDLRCEVREKLIDFIQAECPSALPQRRNLTALRDADLKSITDRLSVN